MKKRMRDLRDIFAENLRWELTRYNGESKKAMSQAEFANQLNDQYFDGTRKVKTTAVSNWYNGEKLPRAEIIQCIADFFGRDVGFMLSDHTEERQQESFENMPLLRKEEPSEFEKAIRLSSPEQRQRALRVLRLNEQQGKFLDAFLNALNEYDYPLDD